MTQDQPDNAPKPEGTSDTQDSENTGILRMGSTVLAWSNVAALAMAFVAINVLKMQMQTSGTVWPKLTQFLLNIPWYSYALLMGLVAAGVLAMDRSIKHPVRRLVANMMVSLGLVIVLVSLILALFLPFLGY